jgi:hypothetical protein
MAERGTVTAELAIGLPGLVVVVAMALWGVAAMASKVACVDAARAGVRVAARGEPMPAVRAAIRRLAPAGSQVVVRRAAATTTVEVAVALSIPLRRDMALGTIRATATGVTEPGVTGPGVTEPGITGPGVTGTGVTGPGVTGPGATGPGAFVADEGSSSADAR